MCNKAEADATYEAHALRVRDFYAKPPGLRSTLSSIIKYYKDLESNIKQSRDLRVGSNPITSHHNVGL